MIHLAHNQDYPIALYIVATPIGNLADITLRALYVLSNVDYIACEDTRHSGVLLQNYNIKAKLISCHQHNQKQVSTQIIEYLNQGLKIAYISDAGTPGISDPASILVNEIIKAKHRVIPIGGISTPSTLMSIAGLDSNYHFAGFLPTSHKAKLEYLEQLSLINSAIVFFESPKRIKDTLEDIKISFKNRRLIIARELSKKFEQIIYTSTNEDLDITAKGEFCIVIDKGEPNYSNQLINDLLKELVPEIGSKKASKIIAQCLNLNSKEIYQLAVAFNKIS